MTDATILIPTFRHAALLPYAIESALDQEGVSIELFVQGDGVEDATREVMARYERDPRVRFFDLPKGARLGEGQRHGLLLQASGRIVAYLSDDDLFLRDHVVTMLQLLEDADFAHPPSARFEADGTLLFFPWDYSRPEFRELARGRRGSIGLTGVAHTMDAYRRLPYGWRTTPEGMPTDHWMSMQFMELPAVRCVMGERLTCLTFPDPVWGKMPAAERAERLADWLRRSRESGFDDALDRMLREATRRAVEDYHLWARREQLTVEALYSSRMWRLRDRLVRFGPLRKLLGRSRVGLKKRTAPFGCRYILLLELLSIPAGVYHAVCNVGDEEGGFVNLPSRPYQHDDPDKYRLPLDNDVIPYRLSSGR